MELFVLEKVVRYRTLTLDIQPPSFRYCRAAVKTKCMKSPDSPFRKGIRSQISWQKWQRFHLWVKSMVALPTFTPGHRTRRVMPPYALLSLPRPSHRITHATTLSKMGNLLKWRMQKTLSTEGFLPISISRTSTSAAKLFSVREVVDRSKLRRKRGDNPPEDRQQAWKTDNMPTSCKVFWCWNGQERQSNM